MGFLEYSQSFECSAIVMRLLPLSKLSVTKGRLSEESVHVALSPTFACKVRKLELRRACLTRSNAPSGPGMVMCLRLLGESSSCASPLAVCGHDNGSVCFYDLRATSAAPLMDVRLHKEPGEMPPRPRSAPDGGQAAQDRAMHSERGDS